MYCVCRHFCPPTYKAILEALDEDTEVNNENQELIAVADDIQKTLRRA